jgi:tetratricopeptide (TPR) repeat protein
VVPDPQRLLVGLFGVGPPLPRIFLLDGTGQVLYRADGFDDEVRQVFPEKIRRAARLAGLGLPQVPEEVPRRSASPAGSGEAPSIVRRLERDRDLRFNLSRGDYFFSNGHHRQALPHYERYLELEPGSLHALVRLAQCHDQLRDFPEARRSWERVGKLSPGHAEARARLEELDRAGVR